MSAPRYRILRWLPIHDDRDAVRGHQAVAVGTAHTLRWAEEIARRNEDEEYGITIVDLGNPAARVDRFTWVSPTEVEFPF